MAQQTFHVDIHGQRYAIRSELDAQYIGSIASYLDDKMKLAARELATSDPLRVAIVAALNIADELFRARTASGGMEGRLLARAADIEQMVDQVLKEARRAAG